MTATYDSIATTTLTTNATSVTFSSIPGTYTDLILVINANMTGSGNSIYLRINDDTGTTYSASVISGTGTTVSSFRSTNNPTGMPLGGYQGYSTDKYTLITHFNNYANTTTYKNGLSHYADANSTNDLIAGLWRSTSAITKLFIYQSSNNTQSFTSGSIFTLYGIKAE